MEGLEDEYSPILLEGVVLEVRLAGAMELLESPIQLTNAGMEALAVVAVAQIRLAMVALEERVASLALEEVVVVQHLMEGVHLALAGLALAGRFAFTRISDPTTH